MEKIKKERPKGPSRRSPARIPAGPWPSARPPGRRTQAPALSPRRGISLRPGYERSDTAARLPTIRTRPGTIAHNRPSTGLEAPERDLGPWPQAAGKAAPLMEYIGSRFRRQVGAVGGHEHWGDPLHEASRPAGTDEEGVLVAAP